MENSKLPCDISSGFSQQCINSVQDFYPQLTTSFEHLTIDVKGIVKELHKTSKRDTDSIRREFSKNGIDSGIVTQNPNNRQPPPGYGHWPLTSLENQSINRLLSFNHKMDLRPGPLKKSETSTRYKLLPKENGAHCVFCYNNREKQETYMGHVCRDENGLVVCPKLRNYVCPYCRATGDLAHTKKYCPKKPIITPDDLSSMASPFVGQNGNRWKRNHTKKTLRF